MIDALEFWFGPYPFYEDSYKLVEVSYTGNDRPIIGDYNVNKEGSKDIICQLKYRLMAKIFGFTQQQNGKN